MVAISTVSGMRYDLVKPILENCSADTLLRLEETNPVCATQLSPDACTKRSSRAIALRK